MRKILPILGLLTAGALFAEEAPPAPPSPVRLTVTEAVRRAREANPAAEIARARIDAADGSIKRAAAFGLPTVYLAGGYDATDYGGRAFGTILNQRAFSPGIDFNRVGTYDNLGVAIGARQSLYDGGRTSAMRRAAEAGSRAMRRDAETTDLDLAARAFTLWQANAAAGPLVEAAKAQVAALEGSVARAKARVDAGALLPAEKLLLEVRLAAAREQLVDAEAAQRLAARALLTLLDLPGDTVETTPSAADSPPAPVGASHDTHPAVAAMRERVAAAEGAEDAARAGRSPRVMLQGEYGYNHGFRTGEAAPGFAAGIRVEYNLFDGDLASGDILEARGKRREAEAALHAVELEISRAADEAKIAGERARAALRVTEHAVAAAEENARVTRERFAAGAASALQVADSESALLQAKAGRIRAVAEERSAGARRRAALGLPPIPELSPEKPSPQS